jgi:hypothetical protein
MNTAAALLASLLVLGCSNAPQPGGALATPCTPGARQCYDRNSVAICNPDGQSWRRAQCGAEQHCQGGRCVTNSGI